MFHGSKYITFQLIIICEDCIPLVTLVPFSVVVCVLIYNHVPLISDTFVSDISVFVFVIQMRCNLLCNIHYHALHRGYTGQFKDIEL